jgi:pimeloyl-ACP methyl ester carboxylesterase
MGRENLEEFGAALAGPEPLRAYLEPVSGAVGADDIADALGDLLSDVDRASLAGGFAAYMAHAMNEALRPGIWGWFDDDLAFVRDWGFDLASIRVPVTIWQGDQDRMVPFDHGRWLAANVPGATARLLEGDGHLSIAVGRFGEILDELLVSVAG